MKKLLILPLLLLLSGCATVEQYVFISGDGNTVYCAGSVEKPVSVVPSIQADGNTVPMSAIP